MFIKQSMNQVYVFHLSQLEEPTLQCLKCKKVIVHNQFLFSTKCQISYNFEYYSSWYLCFSYWLIKSMKVCWLSLTVAVSFWDLNFLLEVNCIIISLRLWCIAYFYIFSSFYILSYCLLFYYLKMTCFWCQIRCIFLFL